MGEISKFGAKLVKSINIMNCKAQNLSLFKADILYLQLIRFPVKNSFLINQIYFVYLLYEVAT